MNDFATNLKDYVCPTLRTTTTKSPCTIERHLKDYVIVRWDKDHPRHRDYLGLARSIKTQTFSPGWTPTLNGWVFKVSAVSILLQSFPTFTVADDVRPLTKTKKQDAGVACQSIGLIAKKGSKIFLAWTKNPKMFNTFLSLAQGVKQRFGGTYSSNHGGWLFPLVAQNAVIEAFLPHNFTIDPSIEGWTFQKQQDEPADISQQLSNAADDIFDIGQDMSEYAPVSMDEINF